MGTSTTEYVNDLRKIPACLDKIIVSGLGRTDESVVKKQFHNLAKSNNLEDLFTNIQEAKARLVKLDVFRYVYAVVDISEKPGKYRVIFKVEEKRPITARLSLTHGTDNMSKAVGALRINNLLRGAEFADLDVEIGTNRLLSACATFSKPLENNPFVRFSLGGTDGKFDHYWAKYLRQERSCFSEIRAQSNLGLHRFQWEAAWREIEAKDNSTPWAVRKQCGSSLKIGLRHSFEVDQRPDLVFPDGGYLVKMTKELASITPGDLSGSKSSDAPAQDRALQLKVEGIAQKPFRLSDWLVGELTFSSGFAHSLTGHPVHIADRFFIGGPLELRGFQWHTVGPMEPLLQPGLSNAPPSEDPISDDAPTNLSPVGSEAFWLSGAHLYTPLPYFGAVEDSFASHFRLHGFYIMGSTMESPMTRLKNCFSTGTSIQSTGRKLFTELTDQSRAVLGAGLVVRFAGALRIEINYCIPVRSQPGDFTKPGFSFGLGMYYS